MTTTDQEPVLLVERQRALYGDLGLTRDQLADLARVPGRLIDAYASCRHLPPFFEGLLRIAAALQVPVEDLVHPALVRRIRLAVARRRIAREVPPDYNDPAGVLPE